MHRVGGCVDGGGKNHYTLSSGLNWIRPSTLTYTAKFSLNIDNRMSRFHFTRHSLYMYVHTHTNTHTMGLTTVTIDHVLKAFISPYTV